MTGTLKVPYWLHALKKLKPHYDLGVVQRELSTVGALRITKSATACAEALGLTLQDVVAIIQRITREHFYKSMTSKWSSAVWQDVYHVPHDGFVLYVKLTKDAEGYLVISIKEK